MPNLLHQIAQGTQPNLVQGIAKIFQDVQKRRSDQALAQQRNFLLKQQNQIASDKFDLNKLKQTQLQGQRNIENVLGQDSLNLNTLKQSQLQGQRNIENVLGQDKFDLNALTQGQLQDQRKIENDLAKNKFIQQKVLDKQTLATRRAAQVLSKANKTKSELFNIGTRARSSGIGMRSLFTLGTEAQRAAQFPQMKQRLADRGFTLPFDVYPGDATAKQFISAANVTFNAAKEVNKTKDALERKQEIKLANDKSARERLVVQQKKLAAALPGTVTQKQLALTQLLDEKGISKAAAAELNPKQRLALKKETQKSLKAVTDGNSILRTMDDLISHPGLEDFFGSVGILGVIPFTDAANFKNKAEQFSAQKFSTFIQTLSGLGAVSNVEGQRIINTIAPLSAFSEATDYIRQLVDAKRSILDLVGNRWAADNPNIPEDEIRDLIRNPQNEREFQAKYGRLPKAWGVVRDTLIRNNLERAGGGQDPGAFPLSGQIQLPPRVNPSVPNAVNLGTVSPSPSTLPPGIQPPPSVQGGQTVNLGGFNYQVGPNGVLQSVTP